MINFFKIVIAVAPLSIPALFFSLGIIAFWTQHLTQVCFIFFCSITGLVFLTRISFCKKTKLYLVSSIFFIPLGFFSAKQQMHAFEQKEQLLMQQDKTICAKITDIEKTPYARFPYCVTLHVVQVKSNTKENIPCNITLKCHTFRYGNFTVGDYVTLHCNSVVPPKGEFRYFLIKEEIGAYLFIPVLNFVLLSRPSWSISRFLYKKRSNLFVHLKQWCSEKTKILFELLFLGRKEKTHETVRNIQESFRQWGIVHMTARSGMHMTIFVTICNLLLQFFPLAYTTKQILLALVMLLYACFSYSSISFMRALLTTLCLLYCHYILRRTNILHVTLLVYIVQLFLNPIVLFFLDFQLSFLLTIGIGFFSKRIFLKY